jgi:hypothetical protein
MAIVSGAIIMKHGVVGQCRAKFMQTAGAPRMAIISTTDSHHAVRDDLNRGYALKTAA